MSSTISSFDKNSNKLKNYEKKYNEDMYENIHQEYMDLATRDLLLMKIESQIESKRRLLMEKKKFLEKTSNENDFLKLVLRDYTKYYDKIKEEKENQIRTMSMLDQYIKNIIKTGKLTEADIEEARKDQKLILGEIETVRKELDDVCVKPPKK